VVDKTARYLVVQKIGVAADVAQQLDRHREFQGLTADGTRFNGQ
jgi:hypothetical protein